MYTAIRATSLTLCEFLRERFAFEPALSLVFGDGAMVVSLHTPQEMRDANQTGLSLWLYRIDRDEQRVNAPPERLAAGRSRRTPLPLRLHYLATPLVDTSEDRAGPELEQAILGKVLQCFYDAPLLRGVELRDDLAGTTVELRIRLESQNQEEITRVWEALQRSYQLCLSYEVSVVYVESQYEVQEALPVQIVMPEFGLITAGAEARV